VLYLSDSRPGFVSVDKMTAPRAQFDQEGKFIFTNVPPGKYSLVLDLIISTIVLKDPESGGDLLIDVVEGETVDMGTLVYPDVNVSPQP
jgi:hypothetical protein